MLKSMGTLMRAAALPLLACLSCGKGPDTCDISGQYSNSETTVSAGSGTCTLPYGEKGPIAIAGAGPDHTVTFANLGRPCPAVSNGCSLSVQCDINVEDPSGNPVGTETLSADWTFTSTGFTGSSSLVIHPSDGGTCTWTFDDTATRQ
jgi:hypothetical protein